MSFKINELFSVAGKTAIVTGGSRGIGKMIAQGFVENGVKTYISARKDETCDATAADLSAQGSCIALPADLSTSGGLKTSVDDFKTRECNINVMVTSGVVAW